MVGVPRLFLIDSFGFIFRAYHARARTGAPPMRTAAGVQTEAVYIFHNMVKRLQSVHKPEYLVAIFESLGPTFRDAAFAAYKANRTETPPDLIEQIPWIRKTLEAMRIPLLEYDGFEADDVIGTLACRAAEQGVEVAIVSSDKDMLQLVNDRVRMMNPMKDDLWYDAAETEKYMGVQPSQVADLLALKGDSVDNIPGAPGIGDKGAKDLITRFGSVEGALEHAAEVEKRTYRESLQNHRDQILLSKQLATIHTDVPVPFELELWKAQEPDKVRLRELYKTLEFNRLLREMAEAEPAVDEAVARREYRQLQSREELDEWLRAVPAEAPVAVAVGEMMSETVVGLAAQNEACSVALGDALPDRATVGHDIKTFVRRFGELPNLAHDVMLYEFLLSADPAACSLAAMAERHLGHATGSDPAGEADAVLAIFRKLRPEVEKAGLADVYARIDLPLIRVLAEMESTGIRVDPAQLRVLSGRMETEMVRLGGEVYELAGKSFNINSPQQLGKVLFEELKLPAPGKDGEGQGDFDGGRCAGRAGGRVSHRGESAGVPAAREIEGDVCGRAAVADRSLLGAAAYDVQSDGSGDGAAVVIESESAEHSDPDGVGAGDSGGVCTAARVEIDYRGLFADRAAAAGAYVARCGAGGSVPQWRGHPHAHGGRGIRHSSADDHAGAAAQREGSELWDRVRADAVRAGGDVGDRAQRGRIVYPRVLRTLCGRAAVHRLDHRRGAKERRGGEHVRAQAADSGHAEQESECSQFCGADSGEYAAAGDGGGSD